MNLQDQYYRALFSSPHMVRALFHGILPPALLAAIDLDTLKPLPTNYVSGRRRDRRSDLAWQVRRRDGVMLYLLLMLEHQSEQDTLMGVRFMGYGALLYEDLVRRGQLQAGRLPPILPILLYSGKSRWNVPMQVSDLLEPAPLALRPYQPDMRYLVLDMGALAARGDLPADNLAALLFQLEHNRGFAHTRGLLRTALRLTQGPQYRELRLVFGSWVRHVLLPRSVPQQALLAYGNDLQEVTTMLEAHDPSDWGYQWKQEGRQEGRQEGAAGVLEHQLARRFGAFPESVRQRLRQASAEQIEAWSLNILDAQRLEDVFGRQGT